MNRNATNNCVLLLEAFEGVKFTGYLCPAGVPTISAGITSGAVKAARETITYAGEMVSREVRAGKTISLAEHKRLFAAILDHFDNAVSKLVEKVEKVEPHEFDALVSLAWNIGTGALAKSQVLKRLLAGDKAGAAAAFASWNKATIKGQKVVVKGLVRRRDAERALFLGDVEQAFAIGAVRNGPMPQKVETPAPAKTITQSTELPAAGGLSIAMMFELYRQFKDAAIGFKDFAANYTEVFGQLPMHFWLILFGLFCAGFWFAKRFIRLKSEEDTSAHDAVDVNDGGDTWGSGSQQQSLDFSSARP